MKDSDWCGGAGRADYVLREFRSSLPKARAGQWVELKDGADDEARLFN